MPTPTPATVRRTPTLADLSEAHGDRLVVETLDLTRPADVTAVLDRGHCTPTPWTSQ